MEGLCQEEILALQRCRNGSAKAFEVIVHKYMKDAYSVALGLVGNHDDAMELSQEAFFRAYSHIGRLSNNKKFVPWFYQILRNLCFSHLRKKKIRHASSLDNYGADIAGEAEGDHFDPEVLAERNEIKDRIWEAIGQLEAKHREVIVLRHFNNLSYDEIAERLFCSKGTVMSRLYYARKKLHGALGNVI